MRRFELSDGETCDEDAFEWPASMLRRVHPRRDRPLPTKARKTSVKAAYRNLRKAWPMHTLALLEFLPLEAKPHLESLIREFEEQAPGDPPIPSDATRQAVAFLALRLRFQSDYSAKRDPVSRHLVDYWVQGAGLPFAVESLCRALEMESETAKNLERAWGLSVGDGVGVARWGVGGFDRLRHYLASADEEVHAAALDIAAARWPRFKEGQKSILCYLFPEQERWLEACLSLAAGTDAYERFYFFSIGTKGQLERVDGGRLVAYYTGETKLGDLLPTLVYNLGTESAPIFGRWLEESLRKAWFTAPNLRDLAEVVALIPNGQALVSLLAGLEKKPVQPALTLAIERFPRRMLRLLAAELDGSGQRAERAEILVKGLLAQHPGITDEVDGETRRLVEGLLAPLEAEIDEAPAAELPEALRVPLSEPGELPDFADARALPRPTLRDGRALPVEAVDSLLSRLAASTPVASSFAGFDEIEKACEPRSLAAFAEGLFDAWMAHGTDMQQKWAFLALGHLGDDGTARRLEPLLRAWPKEGGHARAVLGLAVLRLIGSDIALMLLHGLSQKAPRGLQHAAEDAIDEIAAERGLSPEELADRLVPTLGLTQNGSLDLDYGPRRFTVSFDEQLKPSVIDGSGKKRKSMPKPGARDDAGKAGAAFERWKSLKQDVRKVAGGQIARLERAMGEHRLWKAGDFRRLLAGHPLLGHLVRRLLWGVYGKDGELEQAFRVDADGTYADIRDDPFALAEDARVGLVHRIELEAQTTRRWRQLWADYEIVSPFPQLDRDVYRPRDGEQEALELERFCGSQVPSGRVLRLEHLGWHKGEVLDGGVYHWMLRPLGGGEHRVVLTFEPGISIGDPTAFETQVLQAVLVSKVGTQQERPALPFGALSPRAFSEAVRDLEELRRPR